MGEPEGEVGESSHPGALFGGGGAFAADDLENDDRSDEEGEFAEDEGVGADFPESGEGGVAFVPSDLEPGEGRDQVDESDGDKERSAEVEVFAKGFAVERGVHIWCKDGGLNLVSGSWFWKGHLGQTRCGLLAEWQKSKWTRED